MICIYSFIIHKYFRKLLCQYVSDIVSIQVSQNLATINPLTTSVPII